MVEDVEGEVVESGSRPSKDREEEGDAEVWDDEEDECSAEEGEEEEEDSFDFEEARGGDVHEGARLA